MLYGRAYVAHRLAWLYITDEWPKHDVDHKNGIGDDNRFLNLREATKYQNSGNARLRSDNKSGFKGVTFRKRTGRWTAYIGKNGRNIFLGSFTTPEKAHAAYMAAAKKMWGRFARAA